MPHSPRRQGFAYIALIISVAILGMSAAAGVKYGAVIGRRNAEQALLEVGREFRLALLSYALASKEGQSRNPPPSTVHGLAPAWKPYL